MLRRRRRRFNVVFQAKKQPQQRTVIVLLFHLAGTMILSQVAIRHNNNNNSCATKALLLPVASGFESFLTSLTFLEHRRHQQGRHFRQQQYYYSKKKIYDYDPLPLGRKTIRPTRLYLSFQEQQPSNDDSIVGFNATTTTRRTHRNAGNEMNHIYSCIRNRSYRRYGGRRRRHCGATEYGTKSANLDRERNKPTALFSLWKDKIQMKIRNKIQKNNHKYNTNVKKHRFQKRWKRLAMLGIGSYILRNVLLSGGDSNLENTNSNVNSYYYYYNYQSTGTSNSRVVYESSKTYYYSFDNKNNLNNNNDIGPNRKQIIIIDSKQQQQ